MATSDSTTETYSNDIQIQGSYKKSNHHIIRPKPFPDPKQCPTWSNFDKFQICNTIDEKNLDNVLRKNENSLKGVTNTARIKW